ncbi:MAG: glycosyltransferase [Paracoccaceae bacterium]
MQKHFKAEDHPVTTGRLVAVVVTHDRLAHLRQTLARLLETPPAQLHAVVVVENASTDGTGAWLDRQRDPRLVVLRQDRNLGGAGGFAAGMRMACERFDPDWIVVMDDDARPAPGALAAFHEAEPARWDAVAGAVYYPDGRICDMNRPSVNPFWNLPVFLRSLLGGGREGFHMRPPDYEKPPRQVDISSFVGLFLSRAAIRRAGYPEPQLFVYGDDGIYTLGLSAGGGRIGFVPHIRFEHDCSTFDGQRGRFRPIWKTYYYHRNLLLLYRKAAGWWFWPALLVVLPKWLMKMRHHSGERAVFLRLMGLAVRHGLTRRIDIPHEEVLRRAAPD